MKKKFMMLSCIAAVAIATVVGKKTFESHAYETNNLLMQNIEALTNPSDTPNGTIMKYNPTFTKTCYTSYVNPHKVRIEKNYDPETGEYYDVTRYYHSYHSYTRKKCEVLDVASAPSWWENCNSPREAKCNYGDYDKKPNPFEYYD